MLHKVLAAPKWMVRRLISIIGLAVLVMVVAGCDTQVATNVTTTSATLNAGGSCTGVYSGSWIYQIRKAGTGEGGWQTKGPWRPFNCTGNSSYTNLESQNVTGLQEGTQYEFRVVSLVNGQYRHYDANGTENGTAYDSFFTLWADSGVEGQWYEEGEAIPAVNAQRKCAWEHKFRRGAVPGDIAKAEGWVGCMNPPNVFTVCKVTLRVGSWEDTKRTDGQYACDPEAIVTRPAYATQAQGTFFQFWIRMTNRSSRWTEVFNVGPGQKGKVDGCDLAYVFTLEVDSYPRHRLNCWNHEGAPVGVPEIARVKVAAYSHAKLRAKIRPLLTPEQLREVKQIRQAVKAHAGLSPRSWAHDRGR